MRPIPRKLLPHTVTLRKKRYEDRWGRGELDCGISLKFVRMEPSKQIVRDKNNAELQLSALLFYDCRNSTPKNAGFCIDDIIVFQGDKYMIKAVDPLYDNKKLHHYELGLIKSA